MPLTLHQTHLLHKLILVLLYKNVSLNDHFTDIIANIPRSDVHLCKIIIIIVIKELVTLLKKYRNAVKIVTTFSKLVSALVCISIKPTNQAFNNSNIY